MGNSILKRKLKKTKRESAVVFILAFTLLLLSSCDMLKNVGLEKRHYRPGYSHSGGSLKATSINTGVININSETVSNGVVDFNKVKEKEAPVKEEKNSPMLIKHHLKGVTAKVSAKTKNMSRNIINIGAFPARKANLLEQPKRRAAENTNASIIKPDGKSYSFSTIVFIVGAIVILWALAAFFSSILIMSADIALALTIFFGIIFIIIWGMIVLWLKDFFCGGDS